MSLERAVSLALAGRLDAALAAIPRGSGDAGRWVRAYVAAARGRFTPAAAIAEGLARSAADPSVRVAASVTLGSVLRQTGRHREAVPWDRRALRLARTPSERAHAFVGLAADAVGVGDAERCGARLAEASRAAPRDDWRARVRLDWVRTEHALLRGRPRLAAGAASRALDRSRAARARRHEAKSLLFLGVALAESGDPRARALLARAERLAAAIGARPIAVVARDVGRRLGR